MGSHTVSPRTEAHVITWGFGEEPPKGDGDAVFRVVPGSDGKRHAVLHDNRGQALRNHEGHAASVPEGGALIVHPSGRHEIVPPRATTVTDTDMDGNPTTRTEWVNNTHGVRNAVRNGGFDVDNDWDPFGESDDVSDDNDNDDGERE